MSRAALERAIRKEQLVRESGELRRTFNRHANGLRPACQAADGAVAGGRWLRAHPQVVVAVGVTVVVARPKHAWRWARRLFSFWQTWNRLKTLVARYSPA